MMKGAAVHYLSVRGGELAVFVSGAGEETLVLIHGWTLDHRAWHRQHSDLSRSCRVVSFDRRGFGKSTAPPALSREPEDVLTILDQLDIARGWIVGQSQGSRIALAFARAHPARVAGLVLQGAPALQRASPASETEIPYHHFAALARAGDVSGLRRQWLDHPLMKTASPETRAELTAIVSDYTGRDLLVPDAGLEPPPDGVAGLRCPLLVVTGEHETAARARQAAEMVRALPNARGYVIPGAGHLCNLERPAEFNDILRRFVLSAEAA